MVNRSDPRNGTIGSLKHCDFGTWPIHFFEARLDSLSIPLDRAAEIIITSEVARRPDRTADLRREAEAFREISEAIVADPRVAIQRFLDTAIDLCHADAAGLSLPEDEGAKPQFRWDALAGVYADFVGGAVPRDHSPCGLARIRQETIVVSRPGRVFPEFAAVDPAIEEGLIVPFFDNGHRFLGTIWVVHTRSGKKFCANDLRVMEQLAVQMSWRSSFSKNNRPRWKSSEC